MDYLISLLIVSGAIILAAARSSWLVDYAFVVMAFNRGLRRIVDYYFNHAFSPFSPISLTPLVVSLLLTAVFLMRFKLLMPNVRMIFWLFFFAFGHALVVGIIQNRFAAVFQFAEYLAPVSMMGFAATANASRQVADRWIKTVGWTGVGVAAYGWYQYFHPPVWDAMWMEQTGMIGYLGFPEPTQIVVFSTMAERGPLAGYLAAAAIPMIIASRWRNGTGWFAVAFIVALIPLSYVRTSLLGIALVVILNPIVNRGRGLSAIVLCAVLLFVGVQYGIDKLPTSEAVLARLQSVGSLTEDSSFQGRLEIAGDGLALAARYPFGFGFGGTGMSGRINTGTISSGARFGDNGYFTILLDFGWLGGLLFFSALVQIWKEMARRFQAGVHDEYLTLARSWFLMMLATEYVSNVYVGSSLFWVFIGVALSSRNDPLIKRLLAAGKNVEVQEPSVAAEPLPIAGLYHQPQSPSV